MIEQLAEAARAPEMREVLRGGDVSFRLEGGGWGVRVVVAEREISLEETQLPADFTLHAADEVWSAMLSVSPKPGEHSVLHLVRTGRIRIEGDERSFFRNLRTVRTLLEAARQTRPAVDLQRMPLPLRARGSYERVTTSLGTSDVFVERCGNGPQLLALATAGSDTSQWHGVMTDSDLTERFELITIDLPWHGRSSPIFGARAGEWSLTPAAYTEFIVEAADAIGLERPVLLGASMAGAAVVHAIATHPTRFAGGVACQAGRRVHNRRSPLLTSRDIDQSTFVPEWTYGLMNPASPRNFRDRVWWGYSSGGAGLYAADIESYLSWEFDEVSGLLDDSSPHIAVLSGSFDTTVPPDASRELASSIPNASFVEMPELGHFPHAENPAKFVPYLEAALHRVMGSPGRDIMAKP